MAEFELTANTILNGYRTESEGISISEVTGKAIVSIATANNQEGALQKAIIQFFQVDIPAVGESVITRYNNGCLLGLQPAQFFFIFDASLPNPVKAIEKALGSSAYLTDQSDSWVMISLAGSYSRLALERICPIDLHPEVFHIGRVARTSMEHLSVIIHREAAEKFLMLSPRSSAASFLQAIETSVRNVQ